MPTSLFFFLHFGGSPLVTRTSKEKNVSAYGYWGGAGRTLSLSLEGPPMLDSSMVSVLLFKATPKSPPPGAVGGNEARSSALISQQCPSLLCPSLSCLFLFLSLSLYVVVKSQSPSPLYVLHACRMM